MTLFKNGGFHSIVAKDSYNGGWVRNLFLQHSLDWAIPGKPREGISQKKNKQQQKKTTKKKRRQSCCWRPQGDLCSNWLCFQIWLLLPFYGFLFCLSQPFLQTRDRLILCSFSPRPSWMVIYTLGLCWFLLPSGKCNPHLQLFVGYKYLSCATFQHRPPLSQIQSN